MHFGPMEFAPQIVSMKKAPNKMNFQPEIFITFFLAGKSPGVTDSINMQGNGWDRSRDGIRFPTKVCDRQLIMFKV